jgi:hypothetical protein
VGCGEQGFHDADGAGGLLRDAAGGARRVERNEHQGSAQVRGRDVDGRGGGVGAFVEHDDTAAVMVLGDPEARGDLWLARVGGNQTQVAGAEPALQVELVGNAGIAKLVRPFVQELGNAVDEVVVGHVERCSRRSRRQFGHRSCNRSRAGRRRHAARRG